MVPKKQMKITTCFSLEVKNLASPVRPLAPELARTSPLAPKMTPVIKNDHFLDVIIYKSYSSITDRWQLATPKGMKFREKFQRGGGAIFNPYPNPNHIADFGPLNRALKREKNTV